MTDHPETTDHEFYDDTWAALDDMKRYGPSSRHTRRLIIGALGSLPPFTSLCDIGCGDGTLLATLARRYPQAQLTGLDLSAEGLRRAAGRVQAQWVQADISQQAPDVRCDVAIMSEVLEHIPDDQAALRNAAAVARQLVITVPAGPLTPDTLHEGHLRHYTREDLAAKATAAGLEIISLRAWGFPFFDLYRHLTANSPRTVKMGRYGPGKKLACHLLYGLFTLNLFDRGDRLILVARRRSEA
jgi:ubiquinone/menaquinone biosynthesis C-methylase UbiE